MKNSATIAINQSLLNMNTSNPIAEMALTKAARWLFGCCAFLGVWLSLVLSNYTLFYSRHLIIFVRYYVFPYFSFSMPSFSFFLFLFFSLHLLFSSLTRFIILTCILKFSSPIMLLLFLLQLPIYLGFAFAVSLSYRFWLNLYFSHAHCISK